VNHPNPALTAYFKNDPLIYKGKLRVGTGLTVLDSINYTNNNIDKVSTPFYLIHGAQDKECDPKGATNFYEKAKLSDKTYILHDSIILFYYFKIIIIILQDILIFTN
jgi:alpha-beta hydrolase superfamily lysophospholipase